MTPTAQARAATRRAILEIRDNLLDGQERFSVDDALVTDTARRLDQSGVPDEVESWAKTDARGPGGARERFSKRTLLTIMFTTARLGRPMLVTEWLRVIRGLTPRAREDLGLPAPPQVHDTQASKAYYRNLRTRFHAIERLVDFSPFPKNRRMSPEEMARRSVERMRELTPERVEVLRLRQAWLLDRLLRMTHKAVPAEIWQLWDGGLAVDATPLETFARHPRRARASKGGGTRRVLKHSADEDAGWYVREGDHADVDFLPDGSPATKLIYGYEHTHVYMGGSARNERGLFPKILLAMALPHIPGESPGKNGYTATAAAAAAARDSGASPTHLVGDNAYVNARPEDFATPIRELGLELVIDYKATQLGQQNSHEGAVLVDGWWYCPAMPTPLVDAGRDHRNGVIDEKTYQRRLEDRRAYEFRHKERRTDGSIRLMCPAAGAAPTARCELKPASTQRRHLGNRRIELNDLLRQHQPKACRQQTITVPAEARGRFEQPLRHGTKEWRVAYQTLRSTNEGGNGTAKDRAFQDLESAQRRRIRGQAANALITCFMLCAVNLRLIGSWGLKATPDSDGVARLTYSRRGSTSGRSIVPRRRGADPPASAS